MFKLLKDLTRAPEPLNPAEGSGSNPTPGASSLETNPVVAWVTRSRSSSAAPPPANLVATAPSSDATAAQFAASVSGLTLESPEHGDGGGGEETDRDAIQVVGLLHALHDVAGIMYYVETFSELLSVPGTYAALRAFRRHQGFQLLMDALRVLAWRPRPEDVDPEHWQVEEVQRAEAQRLCLEVLAWGMGDRDGKQAFEATTDTPCVDTGHAPYGYAALLPALRNLSPREDGNTDPDPRVLGLLLTHLLGNNYTLLSLFSTDVDALLEDGALASKLGDVTVGWPTGLPLLWAYVWGLESAEDARSLTPRLLASGDMERDASELKTKLVRVVFQIFDLASRRLTDLLLIRAHLPHLPDFLLTRVYGWEEPRPIEVTFPPRDEWYQNADSEEVAPRPEWIPPSDTFRSMYLDLLRRLLDAGVSVDQTWRLFSLVRKLPPAALPDAPLSSSPPPGDESVPDTPSKRGKPSLKVAMPPPEHEGEKLDDEVLSLINGSMRGRSPDAFVFRSGHGSAVGGLEIHDLGRAWPNSTKGVMFTAWVYVSKLNSALTILHLSQKDLPYPLLHFRLLENSQIAISTYADGQAGAPDEVVCGSPDALIPHGQWVHFGIGIRKGRSTMGGGGEARIFVNGERVGVVRVTYPVPKPTADTQQSHQGRGKTHHSHGIRVGVGRPWHDVQRGGGVDEASAGLGRADTEWMLGRTLLLEEVVSEELIMLMHHLGPRYYGNFQDALNKFLTYDGATAIHLYLHGMSQAAPQRALALLPANSALVRAIRVGPAIPEENIMLSLCAKDTLDASHVLNAAVPHASRAKDFRYGRAKTVGTMFPFVTTDLDTTVSTVGGGVVVLKLVDLAKSPAQLLVALTVLRNMLKDSWSASEEMERIHGFELLAAVLRPKMSTSMDVQCAQVIMSILGVAMDDPTIATVHNSAAYRALGLEFELWSHARLDVVTYYFSHFDYLLAQSQYRRYNVLRTFQKSNMVRKLLFAIRSGMFEEDALPSAVDTLRLALVSRWSAEESIKPIFAYLVSALCQNVDHNSIGASSRPNQTQLPAALILHMMAKVLHNQKRLVKLNKALSLHRLLVVFLQSNPTPFVVYPSLDILAHCLSTPGLESFQRSFESEGGFALLAKVLAPIWNAAVQETIFRMVFGETGPAGASLACPPAMLSLVTALDALLQAASDGGGDSMSPTTDSAPHLPDVSGEAPAETSNAEANNAADDDDDERLEKLLNRLTAVYRQSSAFRRALTARRIEGMLPAMVDFAAVTASSTSTDRTDAQRVASIGWLQALIDLSKAPATLLTQLKLLVEQLKALTSSSSLPSPLAAARATPTALPSSLSGPSLLGTSFGSFTGGSSPTMAGSVALRRRPSTEAGVRGGDKQGMPMLRRTLTGESILREEQDKNAAWRMIILSTDAQKHSTMTLERKEHWHRLSQVEWPRQVAALRAENGVWADRDVKVTWRLDGSEGPLRMRSRLERVEVVAQDGPARGRHKLRDAIPSSDELSSAVSRINQAPWEDPFALALGETAPIAEEDDHSGTPSTPSPPIQGEGDDSDADSYVDVEDPANNKMRLVAKTLQAGDVVEEAHNIVRIVGVDALPGLLILGSRNLYLIDGLVQTPDGKVIEADQAPKDVLSIPSGTLADLDPTDQHSHHWPYADVVETNKRAFLFRDVALELYFSDKQNFLVVFKDKRSRSAVVSKMQSKAGTKDPLAGSILGSLVLDLTTRSSRGAQLEDMTRRWQAREISNFAYLQMLNQHANRTPNDVTQYPVFPWVLADYNSQILDLTRASSYRDLSLPMGALTPARREAAVERYQATEGLGETPFHYGTHYSSSMIVCGFMIRVSPFTEIFITLQGGSFDLADRLFSSVPRAWESASATNRGDVRELIPEFFYSPMFLINLNHQDFGRKQVSGDAVDDVELPPWALDDPLLFVHWNREALESDYVSRHLPEWIDLTFGYKQHDEASFNCFHPLSYRGAVDLDRMKDDGEKAASTAIIHNFGQTPFQIFKNPHPQRMLGNRSGLPVGTRFGVAEHWQLMCRSVLPITEVANRIHHIYEPTFADGKPGVQQQHRLIIPGHPALSVQYGFADQSMRVYFQDTVHRLVYIVEGIEVAHAAFASPTLLVTVSPLGVITAWRLAIKGSGSRRGETSLVREATLRGARGTTCIAVSTAWSFLVTGSDDGTAAIWEMNSLRYTRALKTPRSDPIKFMTVNESNGHIVLASERYLYMYTMNGHPIAATSIDGGRIRLPTDEAEEKPQSFTGGISFLKREFLRWGDLFVVGVGSAIAIYRCVPGVRRFEDQEVEPWRLVKQGLVPGSDEHDAGEVTAVRFIGEILYAGFEPNPAAQTQARHKHPLYQWSLPEGPVRHVPDTVPGCMVCHMRFGLLDPRRHCGGCGGAFCGQHALHVEGFNARYCPRCRAQLAAATEIGLLQSRNSRVGSVAGSRVGSRRPSVSDGVVLESTPVRAGSGVMTPRERSVVRGEGSGSREAKSSATTTSASTTAAATTSTTTPAGEGAVSTPVIEVSPAADGEAK